MFVCVVELVNIRIGAEYHEQLLASSTYSGADIIVKIPSSTDSRIIKSLKVYLKVGLPHIRSGYFMHVIVLFELVAKVLNFNFMNQPFL